jgi:RTX calcium-binding nonapeptide repeat (4 copies)
MGSWMESSQGRSRAGLAAIALAFGLAAIWTLAAGQAAAATASKSGANLNFNAAAGETNQLNVILAGGNYTVDDAGANVAPGAGCTAVDANTVTCPAAGVTRVVAIAGNMNDFVRVGATTASTLFGSEGDDTLIGNNGGDILVGCQGDDTLIGNGGGDTIGDAIFCPGGGSNQFLGGVGNDTLHGGPGPDTFDAGAGEDDVRAEDGVADSVNCGDGFDVGAADFEDLLNFDCEDFALAGGPDEDFFDELGFEECLPEDAPSDGPTIFAEEDFTECLLSEAGPCSALRIARRPASLRKGDVGIRVKLPRAAGGVCRAKLRIETLIDKPGRAQPRRLRIGAEPIWLRPGAAKRFQIQISRAGRRLLHRQDRISAKVSIFTRGEDSFKVAGATIPVKAKRS